MSKAFIFDLDGTLVDSEKAIYRCFQEVIEKLAPERLPYAKNILIGPPLRDTASEILGHKNQGKLEEFIKLFIQLHDDQVLFHSQPYSRVTETLNKLHKQNIPMSIATNKRQNPTLKLIKHFGWNNYFKKIECSDSNNYNRNKNQMIRDILKSNPEFCSSFFVGDTVNDGLSANQNQLSFIKVNFGYGNNQNWSSINIEYKINNLEELLKIN